VVRLDFGELGIDTAVRPLQAAKALPLQIGKKTYKKGLGVHANAEVVVGLDERYQAFAAEVGVHPWTPPGGTVVFQVDVDGQRRFDSGVMRQGEAPRQVRVPLAGAKRLVLRVNDAGDGILNDAAHWAEARLLAVGPPSLPPVFLSDLYAQQVQAQAGKTRNLEGRWLPIVVNTSQSGGAILRQRTWVAPLTLIDHPWDAIGKTQSLGVVGFTLGNPGTKPADISLRLGTALTPGASPGKPGAMKTVGQRILWTEGDRLLAVFDVGGLAPLNLSVSSAGLYLKGRLPPATVRPLIAYIPAWPASPSEQVQFPPPAKLKEQTVRYWEELFREAMHLEVPEPLLEDVFRATQVHCLMAARNEAAGRYVTPWCAADTYGPLDTEAQPVILGMSLAGQAEFARRGLDYFIANYNADGLLVKGYTLMGTGQHLWTLGEHYALHPDRPWLEQNASKILKSCRWIVRQTEKTKRRNPQGEPVPESGLVPPGVLADWNRYAYYFYANGHFWAGLERAARILAEPRPPEAKQLQQAADEYRANILRAFRWQRSQMPVVPLRDGTWVSPCPSSLYCYGLTREFFGGVSAPGHDVEAGGQHLIPLGLLEPTGREAAGIIDYLEDRWFLIDGIFNAYPARENEADWFNRGGFAKLQPHYARTADLHALRDDVKPFVRTYFNTFPVLLNKENLSFWEHMNNGGAWNKTHESAWFLQMTRTMLVSERGDELWLAPMVTNQWLKPGMKVAGRQAPTRFGPVSYEIKSAADKGQIEAVIQSPQRQPPRQIVIRLRHPEGKPIRSVTVDGRPHRQFDPQPEIIQFLPQTSAIRVMAEY
jgi:hypothetical protein